MSTEIHQGVLSVRWFAGVQSGDAAATTARLQAALDHPTDDAILFNANGTATVYTVTGLTLSRSKRIIIDRGVTVKLADLSNTSLFTINANNVTIEGEGTLDGNRANQTSGHGIVADGYSNLKLFGLTLQEVEESAIYLLNASRLWVRECRVSTCGGSGIFIRATTVGSDMDDVRVVGCHVDRSDLAANNEKGIAITRDNGTRLMAHVLVSGNRVKMHATPTGTNVIGIETFGSDSTSGIQYSRIEANSTEGAEIGISIARGTQNSTIQNNTTFNAAGIGVEIADSRFCSIIGNNIDGNGSTDSGIVIDGANEDSVGCAVVGNTVRNVTNQGIHAISGTPYLTISGNQVTVSGASAIGIRVQNSDDVRVDGNTVDGSTTSETCLHISNSSRVGVSSNNLRRSANFAIQIVADAAAVTGVLVGPDNILQGTNGRIQIVEVNGGTVTSTDIGDEVNTPAILGANQNNYAAGAHRRLRLSSSLDITITGFTGGFDGLRKDVYNVGSFTIEFADQSGSSSAANQIDTGTGAAASIQPGGCCQFVYDGTSSLWRVLGFN